MQKFIFKKSTWLHLRIPFSFYLLPVFLLSLATSPDPHGYGIISVFAILHLLVYPASNGYNSYFDKDEDSIGGIKHPPKVSRELYDAALIFDGLALLWSLTLGWQFTIMVFIYGMVSKAYSHPAVRLKKYPITGWFVAGFFQGFFTYLMCYMGINQVTMSALGHWNVLAPALLSSAMLWGSYPMTQVYQHQEDARRGDRTISLLLGIKGTFYFTAIFFSISTAGFIYYFYQSIKPLWGFLFPVFLLPVLIYFFYWFNKVRKDHAKADFSHTMKLNFISSLCLNLYFLSVFLYFSY
jgi:1,4-dihydroxy-2-naphthoate octaprenyltransferase